MLSLAFQALLLALDAAALAWLWRSPRERTGPALFWHFCFAVVIGSFVATGKFSWMGILATEVFLHQVLLVLGVGVAWWRRHRGVTAVALGLVAINLAVAVEGFLIEPKWLEVSRVKLSSPKVSRALKVALLTDLQFETFTDYERSVLETVLQEKPDLILLGGDYVQAPSGPVRERAISEFRAALLSLGFGAPLGAHAVGGNAETPDWPRLFLGTRVTAHPQRETLALGPVTLTALTLEDSFDTLLTLPSPSGYHIVLGHAPDYALAGSPADLMTAGHTHGGQVRLPYFGPLLTYSLVPSSWAAGATLVARNATLVVSRGVGMERAGAPPIRFLCRPEVVFIEITPESAG